MWVAVGVFVEVAQRVVVVVVVVVVVGEGEYDETQREGEVL